MQRTKRLRRRITLAFLLFGVFLTLILGISLVAALKSIETEILDDILNTELGEFQRQTGTAADIPGTSYSRSTIVIYTAPLSEPGNLPEHVRNLPQGTHDIVSDGHDYRVLVKHINGTRYVVQFDDTSIHKREDDFIRLVGLCAILTLFTALIIGWAVADHVISPIKRLAYQVMAFKNQPGETLDLSEFGDDEIGVLARKLKHYHEQLQYLLIREKEFASNVSHELRTPVTSISMAAEVLESKANLSTPEYARIQRIQRAAGEMSELIETFLILAQTNDESTQNHAACVMEPLVRKVIEQQRVWLGDKPVKVNVEINGWLEVAAHAGILSVLLANLVRNAFRHTEKGVITISLSPDRLSVSDTGVGIDPAIQAQLFKNYITHQSGDSSKIGLGLTIVQRICERYGWKIFFESEKGQGSRFTVLFKS